MAQDISGREFLAYFGTLLKWGVAILAFRALLLFLGFRQKIPVIDPFIAWLKGFFLSFSLSGPSI